MIIVCLVIVSAGKLIELHPIKLPSEFVRAYSLFCIYVFPFKRVLSYILGVVMFRWSARAIKSFAMAELEARKLKYPNTGTEALLMGILVEG